MVKLQLRLPDDIHREARRRARQQQVSLNQFLVTSISNELVRQETMSFVAPMVQRFDQEAFRRALSAVPDVPADKRDRL